MPRILVLKHMASQNPGIFREQARDRDVDFSEIDLHAGDPIPSLDEFDGLWVMGGSMDAWEEDLYPWLVDEKRLIREAVNKRRLPFLGICLGHQLLADALGGRADPGVQHEIGLFPITSTTAGRDHPLLAGLPQPSLWVNVHRAEVTIAPPGATVLARSEACANHVMQIGTNAFSVQFHPEVCDHTVDEWLKIPGIPEALHDLLGQQGVNYFRSSIGEYLRQHNVAARRLFYNWLDIVYQPRGTTV
jgi:GMP synthase-like glutamine amidotransferase